jgi:hypothetical protein
VTFPFVARQFTWNHDQTVCLAVEGELYDGTTPEDLLQLYEECGIGFAEHLNGAFVAALWDARERKLVVSNDIFGLADRITAAIMVSVSSALGNRTLEARPAALQDPLVCAMASPSTRIGNLSTAGIRSRDETEWINDFVSICVSAPSGIRTTAGVMLSGSLDSRFLAGVLANRDGGESSATSLLASQAVMRFVLPEVAGQLRQHEFRLLSPDYLARTTELTWGGPEAEELRSQHSATLHGAENPQVLFKGYMGISRRLAGQTQY